MLIQSKFKDYYDSGSAYGIDKSKVFIRKQEKIERTVHFSQPITSDSFFMRVAKIGSYLAEPRVLFLCGDIIPYVIVRNDVSFSVYKKDKNVLSQDYVIKNENDFNLYREKIIEETNGELDIGDFTFFHFLQENHGILDFFKKFIEFIELNKTFRDALFDISKKEKVAYFSFCPKISFHNSYDCKFEIQTHPVLKDIGIGKIIDPLTLYGKIEQYLSNNLQIGEPDMVEISDKDKATSHGHDGKYSFKKPPNN